MQFHRKAGAICAALFLAALAGVCSSAEPAKVALNMGSTASPVHRATKAQRSAYSSMTLSVGLPAPWPARVSMRAKTGASPAWQYCSLAMNLKLCPVPRGRPCPSSSPGWLDTWCPF